jgi:hypothetical protein
LLRPSAVSRAARSPAIALPSSCGPGGGASIRRRANPVMGASYHLVKLPRSALGLRTMQVAAHFVGFSP